MSWVPEIWKGAEYRTRIPRVEFSDNGWEIEIPGQEVGRVDNNWIPHYDSNGLQDGVMENGDMKGKWGRWGRWGRGARGGRGS